VYQGYGLTETSPVIATNTPRHHRRGSVGRPLAGVQVRIRGAAPSGVGEIETKGLHVMKGYYRRPDLAEPFDLDGWLRTGDLGYLDRDGYLFVTGRIKDLIVLASGKKVSPDEVEQALRDSEALREACVLGAALDPEKGEEVCAVVVPSESLRRECGADLDKLRAAAGEEVARLVRRLASHKRPTRVLVREERSHAPPLPRCAAKSCGRGRSRQGRSSRERLHAMDPVTDVFLHDLAYALGDDAFDVEASEAAGRTRSSAKTLRLAGFERHHVCRPATTSLDLARRTVEPLRDALAGTGAIVYATCLPSNGNVGSTVEFERTRDVKHLMDFPVSRLQGRSRARRCDRDRPQSAGLHGECSGRRASRVRCCRRSPISRACSASPRIAFPTARSTSSRTT
jgi:hypothetical protein